MSRKATKTEKKSERLRLAESICNFTKKQDEFLKAYETLKDYKESIFTDLDIQIDTKQSELDLLTKNYKTKEEDLKIECNLSFKEYKYKTAIDVLSENGEEAIESSELTSLKTELSKLKTELDDKIKEAVAKEKQNGIVALKAVIANSDLKHKAEIAEIKAHSSQKEEQVKVLAKEIDNLRHEVAEGRALCKSIAEAGKAGAISQNFGKQ